MNNLRDEQSNLGRQIRIEAIRAASRVVAGICAGGAKPGPISTQDVTVAMAKQFARYIETGE